MISKIEDYKDIIFQLYAKEGRSKVYISKLLKIDRKKLTSAILQWGFQKYTGKRILTVSEKKFLTKNRNYIKKCLLYGVSVNKIAKELHIKAKTLKNVFIETDEELMSAYEVRLQYKREKRLEELKEKDDRYNIEDKKDEEWKLICGYKYHYISNCGRVKKYIKRFKTYKLLTPFPNVLTGRLYVSIEEKEIAKRKNLSVQRLVAYHFCEGKSEIKNTVNHIDGNVQNNYYKNLEWVSQSENNIHKYRVLRSKSISLKNKYKGKYFIYNKKYEFKTISALSKFLQKSETQTAGYLKTPEKYNIEIKTKDDCNDYQ